MTTDMVKIFVAEMIGTFVFLSVIIITVNNSTKGFFKGDAWIKIGLALAVSICLVGAFSNAYLNPAVTLMFYLNDQVSLENLGIYICAQLVGAVLAVSFFKYFKNELVDATV